MSQIEDKVETEEAANNEAEDDTNRRRSSRARVPPPAPTPATKKDPKAAKGAGKKGAPKKDPKSKKGGKKKAESDDESEAEAADDKMIDEEEQEVKVTKEDNVEEDEEISEKASDEDDEEEEDFEEKPAKKGKGAAKSAPAAKKGKAAEKPEKKAPASKAPAKGKKKGKNESDEEDDEEINEDSEEVKPKGKGAVAAKKGAPAKKGKKEDDDNGSSLDDDAVVEYMKKANRPYSLINLFDNLHGKVKKPVLQKMLDNLVSKGRLTCKEFGKAKIFLINQDLLPQVDKAELDQMQTDLNDKRTYLREIGDEIKELTKKITVFNKQLTDTQIDQEILKHEKLIKQLDEKMAFYQSDKFVSAPEAEVKKYEESYQKMEKEYKRRRRMCKDGVGQIAEGMNKKLSEVQELVGIEEEEVD